MKTILLRIDEPAPGGTPGYPVALFCDESGAPDWREHPVASSVIPADLGGLAAAVPGGGVDLARDLVVAAAARRAGPAQPGLQAFGAQLFRLACPGPLAAAWAGLRNRYPRESAAQGTEGRRVYLDVRPEALRRLPWELLFTGMPPIWPARDPSNALARIAETFDMDAPAPRADGPLRVLVVVGSRPEDPAVGAADEVEGLERALWGLAAPGAGGHVEPCRFDLWVLPQPRRDELRAAYLRFRPHVFHFVGHGAVDDAGASWLVLWNPGHAPQADLPWTPADIYADLAGHAPALVVLNCCHADEVARQGGVWTVARSFLDVGAAAVLGTQGPVPGRTAATLGGALYRALASGRPIDLALTEARAEVESRAALAPFGWALPYLHLRVPAAAVLAAPDDALVQEVDRARDFQSNRAFVDRHAERARLRDAAAGVATRRPVVLLRGPSGVGKTWLLRQALEACALGGRRLKYAALGGRGAVDFPGVLRAIKDRAPGSFLQEPLPPVAFARLNQALNALAANVDPRRPEVAAYPTVDAGGPIGPAAVNDAIDLVSGLFLDGLRAVAAAPAPPLVVVLDQLTDPVGGAIPGEFRSLALEWLVRPIARGDAPRVTLVLAATDDEVARLGLAGLDPVPEVVSLGPLPGAEFLRHAEEYCRRRDYPAETWRPLVQGMAQTFAAGWTPKCFEALDLLVQLARMPGGGVP